MKKEAKRKEMEERERLKAQERPTKTGEAKPKLGWGKGKEKKKEKEKGKGKDKKDGASVDTLSAFLASINLSEYESLFAKEKVTMSTLPLLTEKDLENLGLPLGPRRALLMAIPIPSPPCTFLNLSKNCIPLD